MNNTQAIKVYEYTGSMPTLDIYTVVVGTDVYGMSENPTSPQGFNQYTGNARQMIDFETEADYKRLSNTPLAVLAGLEARGINA